MRNLTSILFILIVTTACSRSDATPPEPALAEPTKSSEVVAETTAVLPTLEPEAMPTYTAQIASYNLGETTIVQEAFPEDNRFHNMPVRLEGVIGVPESDQTHPVVLIMHGSHAICPEEFQWPCTADEEQKNYEGFTYLVESLAEAGFVALSINVNAEHTLGYGESPPTVRTKQLMDLHLGELAAAQAGESDKFGLDLNGRTDLSQLVWLGHSRGGDFANQIVREQNLAAAASPVGYGPVAGLIFVAPSLLTLDAIPTADVPFSVILPACDGDVTTLSGQGFYESARFEERNSSGTSVYVEGANHNHFNAILDSEYVTPQAGRPDCTEENMLTAGQQQEFLAQYTLDFLQTLYGQPRQAQAARQRLGMDVTGAAPTTYNDLAVRFNFLPESANQLAIMQPKSEGELSDNLLGGAVTLNGVDVLFCTQGYYVPANEPGSEPCKRVNFNQPGYPQQFVASWESSGADWRLAIPETAMNLTEYTAVQLRTALDPLSELNPAAQPQSFTIELVDSTGNRAQVVTPPIDFPVGENQPNDYFEGGFYSGHVHMSTLRIPLNEFDGIDLATVTEMVLIFDQTPGGTLFVADLDLVKTEQEE